MLRIKPMCKGQRQCSWGTETWFIGGAQAHAGISGVLQVTACRQHMELGETLPAQAASAAACSSDISAAPPCIGMRAAVSSMVIHVLTNHAGVQHDQLDQLADLEVAVDLHRRIAGRSAADH